MDFAVYAYDVEHVIVDNLQVQYGFELCLLLLFKGQGG